MPARIRRRRAAAPTLAPAVTRPELMAASEYVANAASRCPLCHRDDISDDNNENGNERVYTCTNCGSRWQNEYRITGYQLLSEGTLPTAVNDPNKSDDPWEH